MPPSAAPILPHVIYTVGYPLPPPGCTFPPAPPLSGTLLPPPRSPPKAVLFIPPGLAYAQLVIQGDADTTVTPEAGRAVADKMRSGRPPGMKWEGGGKGGRWLMR